jgi:hypothetical protein
MRESDRPTAGIVRRGYTGCGPALGLDRLAAPGGIYLGVIGSCVATGSGCRVGRAIDFSHYELLQIADDPHQSTRGMRTRVAGSWQFEERGAHWFVRTHAYAVCTLVYRHVHLLW